MQRDLKIHSEIIFHRTGHTDNIWHKDYNSNDTFELKQIFCSSVVISSSHQT